MTYSSPSRGDSPSPAPSSLTLSAVEAKSHRYRLTHNSPPLLRCLLQTLLQCDRHLIADHHTTRLRGALQVNPNSLRPNLGCCPAPARRLPPGVPLVCSVRPYHLENDWLGYVLESSGCPRRSLSREFILHYLRRLERHMAGNFSTSKKSALLPGAHPRYCIACLNRRPHRSSPRRLTSSRPIHRASALRQPSESCPLRWRSSSICTLNSACEWVGSIFQVVLIRLFSSQESVLLLLIWFRCVITIFVATNNSG